MKKLSRRLFNGIVGDTNTRKALVLYLFVKTRHKTSIIPNFTYKQLSRETGLCYTALKKRIDILKRMNLIEYCGKGNKNLFFKRARSKQSNINLEQIDLHDINTMECGLCAMFLVEKQVQKEYVKQLLAKKENVKTCQEYRELRRKIRKCGACRNSFVDNGISYKYIAKHLHTGFSKVVEAIEYAENMGLLVKQNHLISIYGRKGDAMNAFKYMPYQKNTFATNSNVYKVFANTYHLTMPLNSYGI